MIEKRGLQTGRFTHKGFHGILHTFFPVAEAPLLPLKGQYGDCFKRTLFFVHDDYVEWFWDAEEMDRIGRNVIEHATQNRSFLPRLLRQWHGLVRNFEHQIHAVQLADLSALSDADLLSLYAKFYHAYTAEFGLALSLQDPVSMHADSLVEPTLRQFLTTKGLNSKFNDIYAVLFAPTKASFLAREQEELLKIAAQVHHRHAWEKLKNDPARITDFPALEKQLQHHAEKYFWISNNYAKTPVLTVGDFLARALDENDPLNQIRHHQTELAKNRHYKAALARKLKLPHDIKTLVRIGETFSYMQDERKKYVLISNHFQMRFLKEISRRTGQSLKRLQNVVFSELAEVLAGNFDWKKADARARFCFCLQTPGKWEIVEGKKAQDIFKKHFQNRDATGHQMTGKTKDGKINELVLHGTCANPGYAKGPVKIIRKTHDLINMKQGDILVASMTRPEMLVALKKAAAIVTDEGGITSHAAVVSRELGIPCLIGTKHATKWLKDGDWVDVDAKKGMVHKVP
ncbi:hypothetical protein HY994_00430 [Candidatus Micrarchaeota archaeon]|nr:hypothetical protein [Candidatus Micrarchaeota archaeon]